MGEPFKSDIDREQLGEDLAEITKFIIEEELLRQKAIELANRKIDHEDLKKKYAKYNRVQKR